MIPNQQAEDAMVSNYKLDTATKQLKRAQWVKEKLENSAMAKQFLFFITILGTSMVIGDGVLTPCISGMLVNSIDSRLIHMIKIKKINH